MNGANPGLISQEQINSALAQGLVVVAGAAELSINHIGQAIRALTLAQLALLKDDNAKAMIELESVSDLLSQSVAVMAEAVSVVSAGRDITHGF